MAETYSYSFIPYAGNEETILEVRNRNRRVKQSRTYLDWRFTEPKRSQQPLVFLVKASDGKIVGMVAVIWRQYQVRGESIFFPIMGDIALDESHRGQGLATKLFNFIGEYSRQNNSPGLFVMPNEIASRRLASAGWTTLGQLAPYVCVLDSSKKLKKFLRLGLLVNAGRFIQQSLLKRVLSFHTRSNILIKTVSSFDSDFDTFWKNYPKSKIIVRDRSAATLKWRYSDQPGASYGIQKFYHDNKFVGYAVFDQFTDPGDCLICEFMVAEQSLFNSCLAQFLKQMMSSAGILTVRTILIEDGAAARDLKPFGFVKRSPITPFQIFNAPPNTLNPDDWFISAGDKDA